MTTPFISRADLGDYMGEDLSTSDVAGIVIDAACETVRSFTRRQLNAVTDDVIVLNGSGIGCLMLPESPVWGTTTVEVDGVADTGFVVQGSRLMRTDWGIWWPGVANVEVTYSHGYATSEGDVAVGGPSRMPSDLRSVALAIAANLISLSETRFHTVAPRDSVGGSAPVEGPGPADLTNEQERVLSLYRNPRVA